MNIKTKEAIELYNNLEEFIKKDIDLPAQCVWDMEDNSEALKKIVDKFNNMSNKMLQPLRDANAFTALDNGNVKVEKEYVDEFKKVNDELAKCLETDNEIDIKMRSQTPKCNCPKCLMESSSLHATPATTTTTSVTSAPTHSRMWNWRWVIHAISTRS